MKTIYLILISVLVLACQQKPNDLLANDESRAQIYSAILKNHAYTVQLLDSLHTNSHGRMMLQSDTVLRGNMMRNMDHGNMMRHMMSNMETDTAMCKKMCEAMADAPASRKMMMQTMREKGMVRKDCMMK